MKKINKILLLLILFFSVIRVSAATHPATITYGEDPTPIQTASGDQSDYHNGLFYHMFNASNNKTIYCIDYGKYRGPTSGDQTLYYIGKAADGLTCIVKSIPSGSLSSSQYLDNTIKVHDYMNGVTVSEANCNLETKTGCDETGSINITDDVTLSLDSTEKYYVSSKIDVSKSGYLASSNYKVALSNEYDGTFIVANANETENNALDLNSISSGSFYLKVPASSVTSSKTITISVSTTKVSTCVIKKTYTALYKSDRTDLEYQTFVYTELFEETTKEEDMPITGSDSTTVKIQVGNLKITKIDGETKDALEGVEFKLYETINGICNFDKEATTANKKSINPLVTNNEGEISITGLLYGTYCLKETKSLSSYKVISEPSIIVINKDNTEETIENQQIRIKISKKSILGEDELKGAILQIKDEEGNQYIEFESGDEPTEFVFERGIYVLTETIAPAGYAPVELSFKFQVDENGNITVLSEENKLYELDGNVITVYNDFSKIKISKKNITNVEELPGAKFKIECENGWSYEFTSGEEETSFDALPLVGGVCTLTETEAPEGYERIKDSLKFQIDENGNIRVIGKSDKRYYTDGNRIIIYNGTFPDTGIFTWIGITIIGGGLIAGGSILLVRELKKRKLIIK